MHQNIKLAGKIVVSKLVKGTRILIEAGDGCYELLVTVPEGSIVEVNASRLRPENAIGQVMNDIEHGEKFAIRFKNGTWVFKLVISATVYGDGWHYDVF